MKKFLLISGGLLFVLIAIALLAPLFISGNSFKGEIARRFEDATGHSIAIAGDVHLRFFPFAGVTMEDVTIGGFKDAQPLATLKLLKVDVALLPLLHKDVQVKSLMLKDPSINLEVNAAGENNWQLKNTSAPTAPSSESSASLPANLVLSDVNISDGAITYNNAQTKDRWSVNKANIETLLSSLAAPLKVKASAEWNGKNVSADIHIGALAQFLSSGSAKVTAEVKSELLNITADGDIKNETYTGKIGASSPSLKNLMAWVSGKSAAATSPLAFDVKGDASCSKTRCDLKNAALALDDIKATGEIKTAWSGNVPHIEVNLSTDKLDLNPFLPQEKKHAAASFLFPDAHAAEPWSSEPIDLSALKQFNLTANIHAGSVLIQKIAIGKTALKANIENGVLSANINDADFYQGKATVALTVNAGGAVPTIEKRASLRGVQMGPLLRDAADSDRLTGAANIEANSISRGNNMRDLVAGTSGSGSITIANGAINGFNLADMARFVTSKVKAVGSTITQLNPVILLNEFSSIFTSANDSSKKTDFAEMGGTFTITSGVLSNNDLVIKAPLLRASGKGQINLVQKTIDYRLLTQIVETSQGQGGKEKEGLGIPIVFKGDLAHPKPSVDFDSILSNLLQEAIKSPETVIKTIQESPKDATKMFKGLLKGLKAPSP